MSEDMLPGASGPIRVLLAKGGLDAHERGIHVLSVGLRDAGFDVIYVGLRRSPGELADDAVQEDADFIGISSLTGGVVPYVRKVMAELALRGLRIQVVVGGLIPETDRQELRELGVAAIFGQGALVGDIAARFRNLYEKAART
jgi:methylmalonyl-CoA mutase C-terminal domain/subunit